MQAGGRGAVRYIHSHLSSYNTEGLRVGSPRLWRELLYTWIFQKQHGESKVVSKVCNVRTSLVITFNHMRVKQRRGPA